MIILGVFSEALWSALYQFNCISEQANLINGFPQDLKQQCIRFLTEIHKH